MAKDEPLDVWELKDNLKAVLKRYSKIHDIILFGKKVREGKEGLELAIILKQKDEDLIQQLELSLGEKVKLVIVDKEDIYTTRQGFLVAAEGYSLLHEAFLRDLLGIHPRKLYSYSISHLDSTEKRAFNRQLLKAIKKTDAAKLGPGSVLIPVEHSGYFEDFLAVWNIEHTTSEFTVL